MQAIHEKPKTWLDRPIFSTFTLNWESALFVLILIVAVISRFYDLETRVMSHDESLHTYYSWLLYQRGNFQTQPLMHGPLQFHLIALSYFLFGDGDLTARIPVVLASIATVAFMWNYRRYLGRAGALVAALLFTISPFMLYYGRYVRNESLVALFGVITLWAILRYIDTGSPRYMYYLTAATAFHFTAKETSFIYVAQALLFLGFLFIHRLSLRPWKSPSDRNNFLITIIAAIVLVVIAAGFVLLSDSGAGIISAEEHAEPLVPDENLNGVEPIRQIPQVVLIFGGAGFLVALVAVFFLLRGYGWDKLVKERSFELIILLGTLVLPHLSAFPIRLIGWDPMDFYSTESLLRIALFVVPLILISLVVGLAWNPRVWLINNAIFYAIFVVLFTTIFTNGSGFFTGLVGSLGYWLEQQGVRRGNQPWYYYLAVQIPVYEYLAALGTLLAIGIGASRWLSIRKVPQMQNPQDVAEEGNLDLTTSRFNALALLAFWVASSLIAYTAAGEKMPWLTVHITLPMLLLTAWGLGRLIEGMNWASFRAKRGFLVLALIVVFLPGLTTTLGSVLGPERPFQGQDLAGLEATSDFMLAFLTTLASGAGLVYLLKGWQLKQAIKLFTLTFFTILALFTTRTAITATYIKYDEATEFLVYAHSASGVKEVMAQVEDISRRTTDGLTMPVAYDNDVSWPFTWYLRNYTNQRYYAENPTRDLRDVPVIIVGDNNFGKLEPVVGQAYARFDFIRMWWPNQDYFNLTWERIKGALSNAELRAALFDIWLNRDYGKYEEVTGRDFSLPNWSPSDRMRLYVRKDIVAQIWDFGAAPAAEEIIADPYEEKQIELAPDRLIGQLGDGPGQLNAPRDVAVASDGNVYVADSDNHRIQQFAEDGTLLNQWGGYGLVGPEEESAAGLFNQPWGIAVAPDGSVYVADTWNHRIQKFTAEGEFIAMWGYFAQSDDPYAMWGPRDVLVDMNGNVLVTDTGNKRILIFDPDGNFLNRIGGVGLNLGQFDEPVGIAVDSNSNRLYIADTWNQRVQVFEGDENSNYFPINSWEIVGWYGQSLQNKPYLAVDEYGRLFVTDPEGSRILIFSPEGELLQFWGEYSSGPDGIGLASGVAADQQGGVWVSDGANHRLLHFTIPYTPPPAQEAPEGQEEKDDDDAAVAEISLSDLTTIPGEFNTPRDIAMAPSGGLYVSDSENHRVVYLGSDGGYVTAWGGYGSTEDGTALPGTFNQPWGVAVGPDGAVYVADTGNGRIQKFNRDGGFLSMWGAGEEENPEATLSTPYDVAVDGLGQVLVADTGNQRVAVYDADGNYLDEFDQTELNHPVGLAVDPNANFVYVADTWNQAIRVFELRENNTYELVKSWEVMGWYGRSEENKPYLAVDQLGQVYASDPEGGQVLLFSSDGVLLQYWGDQRLGSGGFGLPYGIGVDPEGGLWVSDGGYGRLLHFNNP